MNKIKFIAVALILASGAVACGGKKDKVDTKPDLEIVRTDGLKIAFYDQDSLLKHFDYYQEMDSMVKKKQIKFQNELASREKALQNYVQTNGQRAQAGQLSQVEIENIQREAQRREQAFYQYQQSEGAKLEKETVELLEVIGNKIEAAGKQYAEKHKIDLLMIKSKGSQFNYIKESMNVTDKFIQYVNDYQGDIDTDAGKTKK